MPIFFEDLHDREQGQSTLNEICHFLGLQPSDQVQIPDQKLAAPTTQIPDALRTHLNRKYAKMSRKLQDRFGRLPAAWSEQTD